jgi:drug efflux transport system permease protein
LLTALTIAREWERGNMEQLFATPVSRGQVIIGSSFRTPRSD